ncbi:unnamed protein product [Adineta steineri]|uniref:AMOP domain-containing protein n=1 Tax=Adineta steineri TaxID=433720 RepID=A0A815B6Q6_9BILA|nr:unnamed protein product [Adineta steineri]CAF1493088.1 unnamed protein product [Adineta steineri]
MKSISLALFALFNILFINCLPFNIKNNDGNQCEISFFDTQACNIWYQQQGNPKDLLSQTVIPPCQISTLFPEQLPGGWEADETCNAHQHFGHCEFHPGAYGCYRSCVNSTGPSGQACYYQNGTWISDPREGGGTVDAETPCGDLVQEIKHFCADFIPYFVCCVLPTTSSAENCNKYYLARPAGTCNGTSAF